MSDFPTDRDGESGSFCPEPPAEDRWDQPATRQRRDVVRRTKRRRTGLEDGLPGDTGLPPETIENAEDVPW